MKRLFFMTLTLSALFLLLTGAFLPSGKEFYSSTGVLSTLNRDSSVKLVATRSSEGPGKASDIFHHRKGRESGTDAKNVPGGVLTWAKITGWL